MLEMVEQRPVDARACSARKCLCRGIEQQPVDNARKTIRIHQRLPVFQADRLPDFGLAMLANELEPFGRFGAMKLNDIGAHHVQRLVGQFGVGVDEQKHNLEAGRRAHPQRGRQFKADMARAFFEMDKADMRCACFGRGVDGGFVRKPADFDLGLQDSAR